MSKHVLIDVNQSERMFVTTLADDIGGSINRLPIFEPGDSGMGGRVNNTNYFFLVSRTSVDQGLLLFNSWYVWKTLFILFLYVVTWDWD